MTRALKLRPQAAPQTSSSGRAAAVALLANALAVAQKAARRWSQPPEDANEAAAQALADAQELPADQRAECIEKRVRALLRDMRDQRRRTKTSADPLRTQLSHRRSLSGPGCVIEHAESTPFNELAHEGARYAQIDTEGRESLSVLRRCEERAWLEGSLFSTALGDRSHSRARRHLASVARRAIRIAREHEQREDGGSVLELSSYGATYRDAVRVLASRAASEAMAFFRGVAELPCSVHGPGSRWVECACPENQDVARFRGPGRWTEPLVTSVAVGCWRGSEGTADLLDRYRAATMALAQATPGTSEHGTAATEYDHLRREVARECDWHEHRGELHGARLAQRSVLVRRLLNELFRLCHIDPKDTLLLERRYDSQASERAREFAVSWRRAHPVKQRRGRPSKTKAKH